MFSKSQPPRGDAPLSGPADLGRSGPSFPSAAAAAPVTTMRPSTGGASILQRDLRVVGSVMTDGAIELLGDLEGVLFAKMVSIGDSGRVKGEIVAETVTLAGRVEGRITARSVHLKPGARFTGDLIHQRLVIDDGAEFEGAVHRKVDAAAWSDISRTFEIEGVELTEEARRAVDALSKEFIRR